AELDKAGQSGRVDAELAQLKGQLSAPPAGEIAQGSDETADAEVVSDTASGATSETAASGDPFSLDDASSGQ
ncbi:MAG TPA: hypothetical protein VKR27_07865, partial [Acidimicrobiales bacterium]|nr:hypothetical protein [Acidimicrobiales bacterium]